MTTAFVKIRGDRWGETREVDPASLPLDRFALDVPTSGTVYAAALNFKETLAALGDAVHGDPYKRPPQAPILYIKPANGWIGYGSPIPCPRGSEKLRMGGTLGVVIGRTACRVSERDALDYVGGYTIVNDVSVPHESYYRPPVLQRCRDGFCPIGPWVVERSALADPDAVEIRIGINGEVRCVENTANLIRPLARLLADVTEFMTLRAGDVLLVGEPANAPLASPGDRVRIEIDRIGWLENAVLGEDEMPEGRA